MDRHNTSKIDIIGPTSCFRELCNCIFLHFWKFHVLLNELRNVSLEMSSVVAFWILNPPKQSIGNWEKKCFDQLRERMWQKTEINFVALGGKIIEFYHLIFIFYWHVNTLYSNSSTWKFTTSFRNLLPNLHVLLLYKVYL